MSHDEKTEADKQMVLIKKMSFPRYEYQSLETGSGSISDKIESVSYQKKDAEPVTVFEGLRNLAAAD